MSLRTVALDAAMAGVAEALHAESGLPERWAAKAFAELLALPGAGGLLACAGDDPAGLVLWRIAADEGEILTICVLPGHRRQGVGRRLLADAIAVMEGQDVARLFLEVAVGNMEAERLYAAFGFGRAGLRPGYYHTPDGPIDALILARDLNRPG